MVMSTKDNSSPVLMHGYNTWMIFLFGLLSSFQKCVAYDVNTSCPFPLMDNTNVILSCFVNKTYISAASCGTRPSVSFNFASNSSGLSTLCSSLYPSGSCGTLPTGSFPCGCTNESGDLYTFQYNFTAIKTFHQNGNITCAVRCSRLNITYFHEDTCSRLFIPPDTTTLPTTTGSTPPTSISHSITSTVSSSSVTNITSTSGTTDHSQSVTTTPPPPPPPFPGWCIAVIVIGIILFIVIIAIVVIIKKCKKEEERGNRFHCCSYDKRKKGACPCGFYPDDESSSNNVPIPSTPAPVVNNRTEVPTITPDAQGGKKWTELTPTTAPGGNNRTELTVQDAKEKQDRNKHLGTDNSPEREKRRKKKKKKKTFQVVDGEPVSREDKSTVNDHKAAQNDNSISVNESSHAIDNGGHRSLPMPKISHLTSVERNSTIFQSETPRKLPPLQLKQ